MLAQNFKTPADLKISDQEFEALAKVLGMLERGEIEDLPNEATNWRPTRGGEEFTLTKFKMCITDVVTDCGTAGCILGWAQVVAHRRIFPDLSRTSGPHYDLFFGLGVTAKAAQAAIALRNYLTHGEPRWAEALAE